MCGMRLRKMKTSIVWLDWHVGVWTSGREGPKGLAGAGHKDLCASSKPSGSPSEREP